MKITTGQRVCRTGDRSVGLKVIRAANPVRKPGRAREMVEPEPRRAIAARVRIKGDHLKIDLSLKTK